MSLARGIEKRLENLVDGVSASVFRGTMHPVTIAGRLVRQLDFLAHESAAGTEIPNDITVVLNSADLDSAVDLEELQNELAAVVESAAVENAWRLIGPVEVYVETSPDVPTGILECAGSSVRGPMDPWGQLIADDGSAVVPMAMNRILIGRALDCDIRFSNSEVSRHHAVVVRKSSTVEISDVRSANGTWVNGDRISERPVTLLPGDQVVIGGLPFTFRTV
jgi:hypothetical protein